MEDEILIEKFLAGSVAAFNTLVWRWEKPIFNFIMRYIGDRELARDLMQQCFIRVYKGLKKLQKRDKFTTWLFQIALNLCRDELRKRKRIMIPLDEEHSSDSDSRRSTVMLRDEGPTTDREVNQKELVAILFKALQEIPEEQRVVIIMKHYNDLKFAEIAEILKTPLNTIKSRMYYGLNALHKVLTKWGLDREDLGYEM